MTLNHLEDVASSLIVSIEEVLIEVGLMGQQRSPLIGSFPVSIPPLPSPLPNPPTVLGKLGPGQSGPGQLGPRAQFATLQVATGPQTTRQGPGAQFANF